MVLPESDGRNPKHALGISIALIVVYWCLFAARQWFRDPGVARTTEGIFAGACIRAAITAFAVWALMGLTREGWRSLGFKVERPVVFAFWTLAWSAGLFITINVVLGSLMATLFGAHGTPAIAELFRDPASAPLWIASAIIGGGFAEELLRAFVLTRFERAFGRIGLVVALVVDTVVFGLGHLYQGPVGAFSAGVSGLFLAFVFLRRRRVIDAMAVHAVFDLMGIAAAYALYAN